MIVLNLALIIAAIVLVIAIFFLLSAYRHTLLGRSWDGEDEDNVRFLLIVAFGSVLAGSVVYVLRDFLLALQALAPSC